MQEQTKLVGLGRVARSAVSSEMVLPCLDVVLGLTARAVEPLVKVLGAAGFETGDDEPGIGSLNPGLDAGMMRSTRLQLSAASWNCAKRRTLPRPGAALKRAAVLFSNAATWRRSAALGARPKIQSTRFFRHQSNTSGQA